MADELETMKDWIAKKQTNSSRITPAKKDKVFETKVKVSADPNNPIVGNIITFLNDGNRSAAEALAMTTDADAFLHEFIDEYETHGGQAEGEWLFVRKIRSGAKGRNAPVKVELSEGKVVDVPKSIIYAVDGRKWRKIGIDNLLPSLEGSKTFGAEDPFKDLIENPLDAPIKEGSDSGGGAETPEDKAPLIAQDDELIALIGAETVETLNRLGLRSGVKIADSKIDKFKVVNGKSANPIRIIGENGHEIKVAGVILGSNFGPIDGEEALMHTPFTPTNMGHAIAREFNNLLAEENSKGNREVMVEQLRDIRKHSDSLSRVFGFDDPEQLEAFFCAWLMKDSTCRLTGIPGTGKTTVINSAATLLANSYGYNVGKRYIKDKSLTAKSGDYITFPSGQDYNVNYGDKNMQKTYSLWDAWRFSEWEESANISGSYLYDFNFLQRTSDSGYEKKPMDAEDFAKLLLELPDAKKLLKAKSVKMADLKPLFGSAGLPSSLTEKSGVAVLLGKTLSTDAGGNEGFVFRKFLMNHFYDRRLDSGDNGMGLISDEMLNECGVAKIDYDKRAEEILYGIEIRQITDKQIIGGEEKSVAAYQFDPTPRKVVTQPIKFFNEANRSGSGVEDAILGLIAEKTVEYRGQTFKSPSFIAWMDTNPHQKGNDLAFVDRIDMELYFGTLSLGGRFNTLVERYGGAESTGSRPEFQLMQGMFINSGDSGFIKPMRFKNLSETWKTITNLPFNASGSSAETTGALLDISMLSVLFTQRYMVQRDVTKVMDIDHKYLDDSLVFTSPLADISTTTNSQFEAQHADWLKPYQADKKIQAPVLITRMLGFRFSNSLIKMTRAMAFLRGKDHVTRQEVIDAMPYCLGHRLGPAREGEDPKGRDIGIEREGMTVANEQDFVREIIMNGYVLRNTESIMGKNPEGTPSLLDLWDSYMMNCNTFMNSTDAYWKYENSVLLPLKTQIRSAGTGITPVHWSIGTMIADNKRRSNNYKTLYSSYQERIQRPASEKGTKDTSEDIQKAQLLGDTSVAQYMKVRGDIAGEPLLFSDDKNKLLSLVDSKINSICGKTLQSTSSAITSNFMAVAPLNGAEYTVGAKTYANFEDKTTPRGGSNATKFQWRCYGDGMGAWGSMVTNGTNAKAAIAKLGTADDLLTVKGADLEANQNVSLSASYVIPKKGESADNSTFDNKMENLLDALKGTTANGVHLYGSKVPKKMEAYADIDVFKDKAAKLLSDWISNSAANVAESNNSMKEGFNACFRISHLGDPSEDSMKVMMTDGRVRDIGGDDDLRLWLSLRCIQGDNKTAGSTAIVSLFASITSACMRPVRKSGTIEFDGNNNPMNWEILPFDSVDTYNSNYYTGTPAQWNEFMYQDVGNMTTNDYRSYQQLMLASISDKTL